MRSLCRSVTAFAAAAVASDQPDLTIGAAPHTAASDATTAVASASPTAAGVALAAAAGRRLWRRAKPQRR